jgi:hypothetical protein
LKHGRYTPLKVSYRACADFIVQQARARRTFVHPAENNWVRKPAQLQSAFPGSSADAAEISPTVKRADPTHRSANTAALRGSGQERSIAASHHKRRISVNPKLRGA